MAKRELSNDEVFELIKDAQEEYREYLDLNATLSDYDDINRFVEQDYDRDMDHPLNLSIRSG